ncbi:hypothetical protein RF11_13410 [Thelohanellus kitauei]|uniref:Uncharacterized protein n=1 Tax=Thelohanellus kitauei TaxID=669202 RepID=A0A0C2N9E2_THEKT|nr:hypothetical protein RF11_13410 [Thelohanellus kitauei]
MLSNKDILKQFLLGHNLIIDPDSIIRPVSYRRNSNCRDRKRKLTKVKQVELSSQGEDVMFLDCLRIMWNEANTVACQRMLDDGNGVRVDGCVPNCAVQIDE